MRPRHSTICASYSSEFEYDSYAEPPKTLRTPQYQSRSFSDSGRSVSLVSKYSLLSNDVSHVVQTLLELDSGVTCTLAPNVSLNQSLYMRFVLSTGFLRHEISGISPSAIKGVCIAPKLQAGSTPKRAVCSLRQCKRPTRMSTVRAIHRGPPTSQGCSPHSFATHRCRVGIALTRGDEIDSHRDIEESQCVYQERGPLTCEHLLG